MNNDSPAIEQIATWSDDRLMFRMMLLAVICADRRKTKPANDETLLWADAELNRMAPLCNERMATMDMSNLPLTAATFGKLGSSA